MNKFKKLFSFILSLLFLLFLFSLSSNLFAQPNKEPFKKPGRALNPKPQRTPPQAAEEEEEEEVSDEEEEESTEDEEEEFKPAKQPPRGRMPGGRPFGPQRGMPGQGGRAGAGVVREGEYITLDFKGELKDLIVMFSDLMQKNFIYDENIRDRVIIIAPNKLNKDAAWNVFLSVLDYKGYNVIESDEAVKIQKSAEARQQPIKTYVGQEAKEIPNQSQTITYVINLQYAEVEQIRGAISQLMSPRDANISTFPPTNTLILTDIASNINRILKIINAIDVAGLEDRPVISVIPLHNASAKIMAGELTEILRQAPQSPGRRRTGAAQPGQPATGTGEQMKIIPDERLNALIVVATLDTTKRIEDLIEKLDAKLSREVNRINVYYLNNSLAEDLQKVLSGIISKQGGAGGAPVPAAGGQPSALLVGKDVFITADKATNSLIISASPEDYTLLKQIIEQLDIMRPQVYVEGLIVEVSQSKNIELGIEWAFLKDLEDKNNIRAIGLSALGGPLAGLLGTATGKIPTLPSGGSVAITKGFITMADGTQVLNIPAIATFFASQSGVNVLAQPQILTSDNEDAEITVGETRRFIRSSTIVSETANTVNTFEFRDVALHLKITPHINKDGFVRLTIQQTVENILPGSSGQQGVETSKREAKTTVVVKNLETIIIGGLIRETNSPSISKIPCLGDLPWLGWLFSRVSNSKEKTNLLIFLKPTVIYTPVELATLSREKKIKAKQMREEDENRKDIFYRTIIDDNYKFWKKREDKIPMLDEKSKVMTDEEEKNEVKKEIEIKPENKEIKKEEQPEIKTEKENTVKIPLLKGTRISESEGGEAAGPVIENPEIPATSAPAEGPPPPTPEGGADAPPSSPEDEE